MKRRLSVLFAALLLLVLLPGCLQVRVTEHRIRLNKDGSGEHALRMIDIRSDGVTDSAVAHDYRVMISSFETGAEEDFEAQGRAIVDKKLYTRGDTLYGELTYSFKELAAAEGLRVREDEIFVVVPPTREIVRTNGKIRNEENGGQRIVWERSAPRLLYVIREKSLPPSVSLAPYYRGEKQ
jgi:hypothetical protein